MLRRLVQIQTQDPLVNRLQDNLHQVIDSITTNDVIDGIILKNVSLVSGLNVVNHTLGRTLLGWFIVRQRAQADLWDTQDANLTPTMNLYLRASTAVVVDVYVF